MGEVMKYIKMSSLIITILLIAGFIIFITTYRFPIGDDCLGQTTYGTLTYVDEYGLNINLGPVIHDFSSWFTSIWLHMAYWGGRLTSIILSGLLALLGQKITGLVSGVVFVMLFYEVIYLAFQKKGERIKNLINKSYLFVILFYIFVYKSTFIDFAFMWTMMCHYVIPTFLLLSYYCFAIKLLWGRDKGKRCGKELLLLNILGFFSAASNEAICATFWIVFGTYFLLHIKEMYFSVCKMLVANSGLIIGSIVTFFSPGNYVRMKQSHDIEMINRPYIEKVMNALDAHLHVITFSGNLWLIGVFIFVILLGLFILFMRKANIKAVLIDVCPYFIGMCGSVFVWGMASYTPLYGMIGFMVLFYIFILKLVSGIHEIIDEKPSVSLFVNTGACIALIVTMIGNAGWMQDMYLTRKIWDKSIETATSGEIVEVPAFPDSCNNIFTMNNWINNNEYLEGADYQTVYDCILKLK